MSGHLTTESLFDYISHNGGGLSLDEMEHLGRCRECQAELAGCRETEQTLLHLAPRILRSPVKKQIYYRLRRIVPEGRADLLFYAALAVLALVSIFAVYNGHLRMPPTLPRLLAPEWLEKPFNLTRDMVSVRPDFLQTFQEYLDGLFSKLQSWLVYFSALSVLIFYQIIDQIILKRHRAQN
jgi:hypothetical protein